MQKKLIALAVAGLAAAPAFAQSNVTIYGLVDVGAEWASSGAGGNRGSDFRIQSGQQAGSRLGFKGQEDLGNGLSAIWTLEMGLSLDNGQSTLHGTNGGDTGATNVQNVTNGSAIFQRQAFAGLKSNTLGQLTFGRQYTPFYAVKASTDPFALGLGGTLNNLMGYVPGNADRLNNFALYVSPSFAGFTFGAGYSTGQENNSNANNLGGNSYEAGRTFGALAQYANGPVYVGLAYHNARTVPTAVAGSVPRADAWYLGASYDFQVVKLFANYSQGSAAKNTVGSDNDLKGRLWNVGVTVPFLGKHKVIAAYTQAYNNTAGSPSNDGAKLWGLGYTYDLSKRTNLYTSYARLIKDDNSGTWNANGQVRIDGAVAQGLTGVAGKNAQSLMVGVQHRF
ncbi:porin Gram-negative type [Oryzomicrobium terrae]|uniref:Porin Gram-negative type n=1 Tax=Oryzomicrobium terrae TaxID=1735038 RepID=A0A5C1EAH1_9RHOO|nr:porin [Oryzomicrobium terrae]QEL65981.1 porin Gram-negative type [Oryzomicrobium terrae]